MMLFVILLHFLNRLTDIEAGKPGSPYSEALGEADPDPESLRITHSHSLGQMRLHLVLDSCLLI